MAVEAHIAGAEARLDLEGTGGRVAGVEPACVLGGEHCRLSEAAMAAQGSRFEDETGGGREIVFAGRLPSRPLDARWTVRLLEDGPVVLLRLELANTGKEPVGLDALIPLCCPGTAAGWTPPEGTLRCLQLQAHSWADKAVSVLEDAFESEMVGAVANERGLGIVAGFVSFEQSAGQVSGRLDGGALRPEARNGFRRMTLGPGERAASGWAFLHLGGDAFRGLECWAELAGRLNGAVFMDPPAAGFYSWYYYCGHVTEEHILQNARFLAANRDRFPVNYIHLDWGWQLGYSCGEERGNEKFPHGLEWLAEQVRGLGFITSIWLTAFMYDHPTARPVAERPELFQQAPDGGPHPFGEPIRNVMGRSIASMEHTVSPGAQYHLDLTNGEALGLLTERYRRAREAGYGMVMLDFVGEGRPDPEQARVADPDMQEVAAVRRGLQAARRGVGDDVMILGCGTPYAPVVGIGNVVRVAIDVPAHWESAARGSRELLQQYFMHGRLWTNYADAVCVRNEPSPFWPGSSEHPMRLTLDEARFYATVTGLCGAAVMVAEDVSALPPERQWLLTLLLPVYQGGRFRPVDLFARPAPRVLELRLAEGGRQWTVAAGLNWDDEPVEDALDLGMLDLPPADRYHAFDVLDQRYLGPFSGDEVLGPAGPHGVRLVNLVPASGRPQLVGTDLHITQGAVEVTAERWDEEGRELSLELADLEGRKGRLAVWAPEGLALASSRAIQALPAPGGGTVGFVEVTLDGPQSVVLSFG
jgi:hypothetical protein